MSSLQVATTHPHEQAHEPSREGLVESLLEALAPLTEIGEPAWADVLERATRLPFCTCHRQSAAPQSQSSMPQEATWPLPIRNRRTT